MAAQRNLLERTAGWLPVLLLGALAALTFWLDAQVTDNDARRDGNQRHDPDLVVEGVRAVELDKAGNPVQMISAAKARHYPDDRTVEFEAPHIVLSQPERPRFTVESERGRISGDRENAYFEGNVRASREGETTPDAEGNVAGPIRLSTEFLHVIPKQERALTDRPVTIEEGRGIIRATGLTLDNRARTLELKSGVKGTLKPPDASATAAPAAKAQP
jgi:lipopolysaccharide export system protein LptC